MDTYNATLSLTALPPPAAPTVFNAANGIDKDAVVNCLRERGFCILRGLFSDELMSAVLGRAKLYLSRPAIAGAPGYWKVDHVKKMLNPFILGGPTLDMLLDERVIDIVESIMSCDCILAEAILKFDRASPYCYFPMHSDFAVGWTKSEGAKKISLEDMRTVLGIGGALYLHDTSEGAFSYCDGTQHLLSPRGQQMTKYPPSEREAILSRKVRCVGNKGDLVLFDDRGFHGPDQPSRADRTVILLDYFRVATIGRVQVSPMPIWSTDIARLSEKQLRVAGAGADYMVPPTEYAHTRFRRNPFYGLIAWIITKAYFYNHIKNLLKSRIRRY